jgi:PAS domain S-box-containing protein
MRDQHRPKQELIHEVAALRKQVADLKDAMTARRRVEDALRHSEAQLRALADSVPVGLCLFRRDGTPIAANRTFSCLLGYDSPSELVRVGDTLGVFAGREEQARVFASLALGQERVSGAIFRRKDGGHRPLGVIGTVCAESDAVVVVVLERQPQPWRTPPLAALSGAWNGASRPD